MENKGIIYKVLTVLFIAFKLDGIISWPWVWIISPMLIYGVIILICYLIYIVNWVYHGLRLRYLKYLCAKYEKNKREDL